MELQFQLESNKYSGLISFRIDWLDLLAFRGTLKSLLQHHSSKASIPWHSALFMVQLSHPYMTAGKSIALIIQTFVGKVMSLLFYISRFVISFSSKEQACFNFVAAVTILSDSCGPKKQICHSFHSSPFYLPWSNGPRAMIFVFLTPFRSFQSSSFHV